MKHSESIWCVCAYESGQQEVSAAKSLKVSELH